MLTIKIIEKRYADKVVLANAEMEIHGFGIYGIVGKNGQGKTSLFKCITGLENYTGSTTLLGNKISLQDVAWCPTDPKVYNELTATEFYDFYQLLLDVKLESGMPLFDVPKDKLIKEFSTGMRKKTYLNAIFLKKQKLYILDEPFNGLDIESNYVLMHYIKEIAKESVVLISSHILDILYKDCEAIFLVKNQKIQTFSKNQFSDIEKELFDLIA